MSVFLQRCKLLDLRFHLGGDEDSFKATLEPELFQFGALGALTSAFGILTSVLPTYFIEVENEFNTFSWSHFDSRVVVFGSWISCFLCAAVVLALCMLRIWLGWFTSCPWECLFLISLTYGTFMLSVCNPYHVSELLGRNYSDEWVKADEPFVVANALIALIQIISVAGVSLYVPIRSCLLWVLPVGGILPHMVLLMLAPAPGGGPVMPSMCVAMMVVFALHGAHRNERHRRKEWVAGRQLLEVVEEVEETSALAAGMEKVARYLCNIVVKLTGDLHVTDMESMHHEFFGTDMQDSCFTDMVSKPDRDRFKKCVELATNLRIPQCLPVTLYLNSVPVEVSMLVVASGRMKLHYLVGITLNLKPELPNSDDDMDAMPGDANSMVHQVVRCESPEDNDSSISSMLQRYEITDTDTGRYMMFNALSPNMTITYVSPAWSSSYGTPEAQAPWNLASFLSQTVASRFYDWLAPRVARALSGASDVELGMTTFDRVQGSNPITGEVSVVLLCVTLYDPAELHDAEAGTYVAKFSVVDISRDRLSRIPSLVGSSLPSVLGSSLPSVPEEPESEQAETIFGRIAL